MRWAAIGISGVALAVLLRSHRKYFFPQPSQPLGFFSVNLRNLTSNQERDRLECIDLLLLVICPDSKFNMIVNQILNINSIM